MRLLVVDDSQIMRNLIIKQLKQMGCSDVDEAADGVEAMRKISMEKYDAVTLDILMPKIDGSSVVKHIKEVSPDTTIIMCSSISDPGIIKNLIKLGIHDFIIKPFTIEKLQEVLQRNLIPCKDGKIGKKE